MNMTQPVKIAVIGGGSTYTPELIDGLLSAEMPVRDVVLVDPDIWRLEIVGGLAERMVIAAGNPFRLTLTDRRDVALDGADAVITQLRVGGQKARILDERIPLRYGVVGQETTGPGGFLKALRTIPVILDIAREMAARCPDAWLVNFTNPSGLITEALRRHGRAKALGLCNYPLTLKMKAAAALGVDESRLTLGYFGLNHLSWSSVLVDGIDRTTELIELMIADPAHREISGFAFQPETLRALGLIPSGYLRYFYETARMVEELRAAPQTRGEKVREVEARLLARYEDEELTGKPPELQERGGAWYSTAAVRLLKDLLTGSDGTHVLNLPNAGALPFLADDAVVETPACVADGEATVTPVVEARADGYAVGEHPITADTVTLIQRVKTYETLAVQAAVTGDREIAREALRAHPLLDGKHEIIASMVDDLLAAHTAWLPQFHRD